LFQRRDLTQNQSTVSSNNLLKTTFHILFLRGTSNCDKDKKWYDNESRQLQLKYFGMLKNFVVTDSYCPQ
jgi:hypothetical protein